MRSLIRMSALTLFAFAALALPLSAAADHGTRPHTQNLHALGHSPHPATFFGTTSAERNINSDLAFWGNLIYNGNYDGFRILRDSPGNPKEISWTHCNGDQGDIVVWGNFLARSWNSPAPAGRFCDGQPVPVGFEGLHFFDVSNPADPKLVGQLPLDCGSHTATLIPRGPDRVVIYNQTSGGPCNYISIVNVPLANPAAATVINKEPLMGEHACHDSGVILGNVNMAACASGHMTNVFDIGANQWPGGSPEDPVLLYTIEEPGVGVGGNWHSAAFTWDGKVLVLGWEPGGGAAPECEATDPAVKKSMFFYDAQTGAKLGQWTLPRPQSSVENCTIHNYNIVPLRSGRYVAVGGHYQAGTWVVDFTNPAAAQTVAWSDPLPLAQVRTPAGTLVNELGGAWSSYWYNNFIYESEITKGLNVFRLSDSVTAGAIHLDHLNPQTQEFSLAPKRVR